MDIFKKNVNKLSILIASNDENVDVNEFENILAEIAQIIKPQHIPKLLLLLDDNYQYDELLFSIVHLVEIEDFDDKTYCKYVLEVFPDFLDKSPNWASTILIRILNSEKTLKVFEKLCALATNRQKESIKQLVERINKQNEKFIIKTKNILEYI